MGILWTLLIGLVAGMLAKLVMPGKDPGGILVTMLLGVAGAFVAGFLGRAFGWYSEVGDAPGLIAAVIGSVILLALYRLIVGMRTRNRVRPARPARVSGRGPAPNAQ